MKNKSFIAILLECAFIAGAAEPKEISPVATAALKELPQVLRSVDLTGFKGLSRENFAISDALVPGGAATLGEHARKVYSDTAIADEMAASSTAPSEEPATTKLPEMEVERMRVLAVARFETGGGDYDWAGLNARFPSVLAVIRLSEPALDRSGTYAAVRYEVRSKNGGAWSAFQFFELRNDSWRATKLIVGTDR